MFLLQLLQDYKTALNTFNFDQPESVLVEDLNELKQLVETLKVKSLCLH